MSIGISSASLYPQYSTEIALLNIAAIGCRHVEVFLQTQRECRPGYIRRLDRLCRQLGLVVQSVHAASTQFEPMLFYSYRRQVLDSRDVLERVLDAASMLGAECYVFHGPLRVAPPGRFRLLTGLADVAGRAASRGIKLALENVSWCVGWEPAVFRWLSAQSIPHLWFTFDNKQAARSGYEDKEFIRAMGSRLINVHLSDISPQGAGLLPGLGQADFAAIGYELSLLEYSGPVILEAYGTRVEDTAALASSWRRLSELFAERTKKGLSQNV